MIKSSRASIWVALSLASVVCVLIGGYAGMQIERDRVGLVRASATVLAQEYLKNGDTDKALAALYLAKVSEAPQDSLDGLLGNAYQVKGRPCLAAAFYESHLRYIETNKLDSLIPKANIASKYRTSSEQCMTTRSIGGN